MDCCFRDGSCLEFCLKVAEGWPRDATPHLGATECRHRGEGQSAALWYAPERPEGAGNDFPFHVQMAIHKVQCERAGALAETFDLRRVQAISSGELKLQALVTAFFDSKVAERGFALVQHVPVVLLHRSTGPFPR